MAELWFMPSGITRSQLCCNDNNSVDVDDVKDAADSDVDDMLIQTP